MREHLRTVHDRSPMSRRGGQTHQNSVEKLTPSLKVRNGMTNPTSHYEMVETDVALKYVSTSTVEHERKSGTGLRITGTVDDDASGDLSSQVKRMSQNYRKFNGHLELIDQVSHRTAEMIHQHITNNIEGGEAADEIGGQNITSLRKMDNYSPPTIFMEKSTKFNKSSPVKDLSFFDVDLIKQQDYYEQQRKTDLYRNSSNSNRIQTTRQELRKGNSEMLDVQRFSALAQQTQNSNRLKIQIIDMQPTS